MFNRFRLPEFIDSLKTLVKILHYGLHQHPTHGEADHSSLITHTLVIDFYL